jgi:hypothetical protein
MRASASSTSERINPMDVSSTTTATLDQADEEILTYTVSDETLEAAAGTAVGKGADSASWGVPYPLC